MNWVDSIVPTQTQKGKYSEIQNRYIHDFQMTLASFRANTTYHIKSITLFRTQYQSAIHTLSHPKLALLHVLSNCLHEHATVLLLE